MEAKETEEAARLVAERFAGTWKTVWVLTMESLTRFMDERHEPAAFKRHLRQNAQGLELEMKVVDGFWSESEISHDVFWQSAPYVPCEIDGAEVICRSPGGGEVFARRVEFLRETSTLRITERCLDDGDTSSRSGPVTSELALIDNDTLHRTFLNESTGTKLVLIYSRSSVANHHRSLALQKELVEEERKHPRTRARVMAFLPAATFFPAWLYAVTKRQKYAAIFTQFWPMSIAMVFGSFIAGSTPLGGGVVGFPVAVLILKFDADMGRDFSAMIQAVGMTSASYLIIYLKPQLVDPTLVSYSIVFGVVGCIVGFLIPLDDFVVNLILTMYLVAFAIVYCYKNEVIERYQLPVPPSLSERRSFVAAKSLDSPNARWAASLSHDGGATTLSHDGGATTLSHDGGAPVASDRSASFDDDDDQDEDGKTKTTTNGKKTTTSDELTSPLLEDDEEAPSTPRSRTTTESRTLLRGLTLDLAPRTLMAVVGETGAGKSGLLLSLLGETTVVAGSLGVTGSIAYCAQSAWIRNASVRENILFGAPFDREKYDDAVYRAALSQDLRELKDGDDTEIGEKGLNISGGQKQRVALARALYADADVYLLDDVLSAVDAHVAAHLFEHLVLRLRDLGKIVVLVTHNLSTLRRCDQVLCLEKGRVEYQGPPAGFVQLGLDDPARHSLAAVAAKKFHSSSNLLSAAGSDSNLVGVAARDEEAKEEEKKAAAAEDDASTPTTPTQERGTRGDRAERALAALEKRTTATTPRTRLVADEARLKGGVTRRTRLAYLTAFGGWGAVGVVLVCQLIYQVSSVTASWWLGYWSAKPKTLGTALGLEVYTALSVTAVVLSCVAYYAMSLAGQRAARRMHDALLDGLLPAPMKFFDATPVGRLINLFSKDLYTIDEELPQTLTMWLTVGAMVLMTLGTISFATPLFLAFAAPLGLIYYATQRYFIPTVRELKRLDATSRSPIFSSFAEALDGATTIRAFRAQDRFQREVTRRLRTNLRAYFLGTACNRWLAVRLEGLGTAITGAAAFLAVFMHTKPYLAGLSLTYALSVTQALNWWIRMSADLENNSVAVERVVEYSNVDHEVDGFLAAPRADSTTALAWPSAGHVRVENLELRYRPELPLVLKGLSFEVQPGTKLSLVGRTGSGKSSFLLALLRIAPPTPTSKIFVDGLDVMTMKLRDLRSRVAMIPQDPVLFTGSVRFNVDPFRDRADTDVHAALADARLADRLRARLDDAADDVLALPVEEGGKNFSQGEAQLLCLARACLRYSKLLLLDEATSSVDDTLDDAVQQTIRTKFAASTVVAIAHRLNTVMTFDRVLVLDAGHIVEDGNPAALAKDPTTRFGQLAAAHAQGVASLP
mmetsp:Transcript_12047/g.36284  ORF Transcript_12047/g.36284 Transcript_12047/m.36284 type:complete len:1354 (+) Transcript_12047:88-4149(+)